MRKRIFIGSASESLKEAELVKKYLEEKCDCECTVWNDGFFDQSKSAYECLYSNSYHFDYAVFVGGKDSVVRERGIKKCKARDNVIFEQGLYAGVLSPERTFFVLHKGCEAPSDLKGITINRYSDEEGIKNASDAIASHIKSENRIKRFSLLPTTALALSYYNSFLKRIYFWYQVKKKLMVEGKEYDISGMPIEIRVVLPEKGVCKMSDIESLFYERENLIQIKENYAEDKRVISMRIRKTDLEEGRVIIYDVPTILDTGLQVIDLIEKQNYLGNTEKTLRLKRREIDNFMETLVAITEEDIWVKSHLKFEMFKEKGENDAEE